MMFNASELVTLAGNVGFRNKANAAELRSYRSDVIEGHNASSSPDIDTAKAIVLLSKSPLDVPYPVDRSIQR
jgi:hypothetical protein